MLISASGSSGSGRGRIDTALQCSSCALPPRRADPPGTVSCTLPATAMRRPATGTATAPSRRRGVFRLSSFGISYRSAPHRPDPIGADRAVTIVGTLYRITRVYACEQNTLTQLIRLFSKALERRGVGATGGSVPYVRRPSVPGARTASERYVFSLAFSFLCCALLFFGSFHACN